MRVGVIGVNHKIADIACREQLAIICSKYFQADVHSEIPAVLLMTCNRTEIYFSAGDLAEAQGVFLSILRLGMDRDRFYTYFGSNCFEHLVRVTSGLDSALLGETEIQGQVKTAYERARRLSKDLHFLFQKSLKVAKEVRSSFLAPSCTLEGIVARLLRKEKSILLMGAGEVAGRLYQKLAGAHVTVCNRTEEHIRTRFQGAPILCWGDRGRWNEFDAVVAATHAGSYLLQGDVGRVKLLIDLSVPRNIDPALEKHTTLLNIDQLHGAVQCLHARRQAGVDQAKRFVRKSVSHQIALFLRNTAARRGVCA